MNWIKLQKEIKEIVIEAKMIKDKHTREINVSVNYACIFAQDNREYTQKYEILKNNTKNIFASSKTGDIFLVEILTVSGILKLLKLRKPDTARTENGDADFTINNFSDFKEEYLGKNFFSLIDRKNDGYEMIEIIDPKFNTLVYFSNPPHLIKIYEIEE